MVLQTFPLPLATAHNAIAAVLVLCLVALLRFLRPSRHAAVY
jgi:heme A synthase